MATDDQDTRRLGRDWRLTTVYGFAHLGKSLFWHSGDVLLAFFLTEVAGLPPLAMGWVLAAGLAVGAVVDVAVGAGFAGRLANARSAAVLQFQGAVLAAVAAVALFSTPLAPDDLRLTWALATAVAFRASYSLHDVPQNAILTLATPDDVARTRVAALRVGMSGLAALILAAGIMPILAWERFAAQDARISLFVALGAGMALVASASATLLLNALRSAPPSSPTGTEAPRGRGARIPLAVAPILIMAFAFLLTVPLFGKLEPYFVVYELGSPFWGAIMGAAGVCGMFLAPLLWTRSMERMSHPSAIGWLSAAMLADMIVFGFAGKQPVVASVCAFVLGNAGGAASMIFWAALADTAARADPRRVGVIYGLFSGVSKAGMAVGAVGLGWLLARIEYRGADSQDLIQLMAGVPSAGAAVCLVLAVVWGVLTSRTRRDIAADAT